MSLEPAAPVSLASGRYRVIDLLGEGGMARVYRAWDDRLATYRAIKVLDPAMAAKPSLRARFMVEARTMARLHHPNIVTIHDVSEDDGIPFIVMELMHGGSLMDRVVEHGQLPPRAASRVARDLLRALQLAHGAGVIHRDVKPQNVLLSKEGVPKLTDFGIAHVSGDQSHTRTGMVMGTMAYMSPEQRRGDKNLGPAADIYSAGATLYTLVTGSDSHDLYSGELHHEQFATVNAHIAGVIKRATRYKAEDRWPSADGMAQALEVLDALLPPDPSKLVPLASLERSRHWTQSPPDAPPAPQSCTFLEEPEPAAAAGALDPGVFGGTLSPLADAPHTPPRRRLAAFALGGLVLLALGVAWATLGTPPTPNEPPAQPVAALVPEPVPAVAVAPAPPAPEVATVVPAAVPAVVPAVVPARSKPAVRAAEATSPAAPKVAAPVATAGAASAPGFLHVNSKPFSTVSVAGAPSGRSPWKGELPVGRHSVSMTAADGRTTTQVMVVRSGATTRYCWDFDADDVCEK